jgi:phage shock protein C
MSDLRFDDSAVRSPGSARTGFHLGKDRAKLMGVCAGIAGATGLDVTLVRVAWLIGTLVGFGSLILIYLAIGLIAD